MEKLKQQFDVTLASLSEAKRFLIPLEQTERVQSGLTLGKSEISCRNFFLKTNILGAKMDESLTSAASALHRGRRITEKALGVLKLSITELSGVFLKINV